MSKFNKTLKSPKTLTENLAGGQAYNQSHKLSLVSLLLTSFVDDQFYRNSDQTLNELKKLMDKIDDKEFLAKSAIYARDKFGMRSITHALAGELTSHLSGKEWAKDFYEKIVVRVDDMTEILSYYLSNKVTEDKVKFPNSLKKGFSKAFDKFDNYQIAKYKGSNKSVKLIDVVNLVHPNPTIRNKESLNLLVNNNLKSADTWESELSKAGQEANSESELVELKAKAWNDLLSNKKLGYFALLRNLRNIIKQSPESLDLACDMLVDRNLIKKSRVLPFRFTKAYEEIEKLDVDFSLTRKVKSAINSALEISIDNVPEFKGETLVVIDVSGSMGGRPSEIASLFGSVLAKKNKCDVMTFSTDSKYINYNPDDSLISIRDSFHFSGGGTNFKSIFKKANKKYDRIIILSDMQSWTTYHTPKKEFSEYRKKYDANPYVYSWDLNGYGTLQFPENNVFAMAGFSDKVFDIMNLMETDKNSLYNEIESMNYTSAKY